MYDHLRLMRRPRIALYSHDTCGLGHTRRNLRIAKALAASPHYADVLLITGARESSAFPIPSGVDMLSLPALYKDPSGEYQSRRLSFELDELIVLRSGIIWSAIEAFDPDIFIVDNVPRGAGGELNLSLSRLRRRATRCVLGLRDVLDDPKTVEREWKERGYFDAIDAYFDSIWVYGDPAVYAATDEYAFPAAILDRLTYTGYLDPTAEPLPPLSDPAPLLNFLDHDTPLMLCAIGGGQDGGSVASAFASANWPTEASGLILTGPFMDAAARLSLDQQASERVDLQIARFSTTPSVLYRRADRVVAMGGYNTVIELLALGKQALIIPRERPRSEQRIRAERLAALGLLDWLRPRDATPEALGAWLKRDLPPPETVRDHLNLSGLDNIVALTADLLPHMCAWPRRTVTPVAHATAG